MLATMAEASTSRLMLSMPSRMFFFHQPKNFDFRSEIFGVLNFLICSYFRYCLDKEDPALLIAFAFPGNAYPAIEHHDDKSRSLIGQAIKSGYQSNYVLTKKDGSVVTDYNNKEKIYDEVVLSLESQVVPLYLMYANFFFASL